MKKLMTICCIIATLILTACTSAYDGTDTALQDGKIQQDFTQIEGYENLYYCKDTGVVYWIGGAYTINMLGNDYTTSYMTVYYAPNGFPYVYNTIVGKIEEVDK